MITSETGVKYKLVQCFHEKKLVICMKRFKVILSYYAVILFLGYVVEIFRSVNKDIRMFIKV